MKEHYLEICALLSFIFVMLCFDSRVSNLCQVWSRPQAFATATFLNQRLMYFVNFNQQL